MKQTEELERKGYVTGSHAKMYGVPAFAEGTVDDDEDEEEILLWANAYSGYTTGRATYKSRSTTKKTTPKSTNTGNNKNSGGGNGNKGGNNNKGNKGKSSSDKDLDKIWKKFTDKVSKLFDWIEVKLSRLKDNTEKWATAAQKAVNPGSTTQANYYQKAIDSTIKELTNNNKAVSKYEKQAQSVGKSGVKTYNQYIKAYNSKKKNKNKQKKTLSNKWLKNTFKKVKSGYFLDSNNKIKKGSIAKYNEKQQEIIKDMQAWYDKSYSSQKAVRDLTDSLQDLYDSMRDIPNVKADKEVEKLTKSLEHLKNALSTGFRFEFVDQYDAKGNLVTAISMANKNLDDQTQNAYNQMIERQTAATTAQKNLNSAKNKVSKNKTLKKNKDFLAGREIEIKDNWSNTAKKLAADYNASLAANEKAAENLLTASDNYWSNYYENAVQKLDNITTWFDKISETYTSRISEINAFMGLGESNGWLFKSSSPVYTEQLSLRESNLATKRKELSDYQTEINAQLASGEIHVGDQRYNEMIAALNGLREATYTAEKELQDLKNTMVDLDISQLGDELKRIQDTISRLKTRNNYAETIGNKKGALYTLDESFYAEIIDKDIEAINKAMEQYNRALEEQAKVEIGSERWKQLNETVTSCRDTIAGLGTDIEEMSDKIRELRWKPFNDFMNSLERIKTEMSGIMGFLKKDNYIGLDAGLTDDSITAIAIYNELIQNSNQRIEGWREALEALDKEVENGNIDMDERNKLEAEYVDNILSDANDVAEYRNEILEIYYSQLQREHELLEENIDLRREFICAYSFNCWNALRVS